MRLFDAPVIRYIPGFSLLSIIAWGSVRISELFQFANALLLAILFGVLITNATGVPVVLKPGIQLHKLLLEAGIILLGARFLVEDLIRAGPQIMLLALGTVAFGIVFIELFARSVLQIPEKTVNLLAAGSSICGVSAVIATAGAIEPEERQIAYAVATILLFDGLTLALFPIMGEILTLPAKQYGVWAGLSMFSTGPVAAAGFAYAPSAGEWATITKLIRNSAIGLVAIAYSLYYSADLRDSIDASIRQLWERFPKFILGFFLVVGISNSGILSEGDITIIGTMSTALFTLAFAGLGFEIQVKQMYNTNLQSVGLVLVYLLTISALSLVAVLILF